MSKLDYSDIGYVEIRYLEMKRQVGRIDDKISLLKKSLTSLAIAINKLSSLVGGELAVNLADVFSKINTSQTTINSFANGQMDKYQELNEEITDKIIKLSTAITASEVGNNGALSITLTDEEGNVIKTTHQTLLKELENEEILAEIGDSCNPELLSMLSFFEGTGKMNGNNYIVYTDSSGTLTVGHGVTLKWNADKFKNYGVDVNSLYNGSELSSDIVNAIEMDILNEKRSSIVSTLTSNNISLTDYQVDALVMRSYNTGNINGFVENYQKYGNTQELYNNYMCWPTTDSSGNYLRGLENRRNAEWELFSNGTYTYE